jgi:hypothetical protein
MDQETTMITNSTLVSARSESDKLNSARRAQGWPRVNILSQSTELASRLATPLPLADEWRPANRTTIRRGIGAWSTSARTILDFMRARNGRRIAQDHAALWNENPASLTPMDLVAIAGLFLTTAFFYPAMVWLLLVS